MFRFIFTGDRNWTDVDTVRLAVHGIRRAFGPHVKLINGLANGLDKIANAIGAELLGPDNVEGYPADWDAFGPAAGPIRNQQMLTESLKKGNVDGYRLKGGFAFHDNLAASKGTKDMVTRLENAGFKVMKIRSHTPWTEWGD